MLRHQRQKYISKFKKNRKMMSEVLPYLLMITFMLIRASSKEVKWTVRDTSPKLGQDLTLFCEVDNCAGIELMGWRGGPDDKVLMANNGISTDKTKYTTSIENNGFILNILNLAVTDLNVSYECSCGFNIDKHILYIEDVDTVHNLNKLTNGNNSVGTNNVGGISLHVTIIISISPVIVLIILIVANQKYELWSRLKKQINGCRRRNSPEDDNDLPTQKDKLLPNVQEDMDKKRHSAEDDNDLPTQKDKLLPNVQEDMDKRHSAEDLPTQKDKLLPNYQEDMDKRHSDPSASCIHIKYHQPSNSNAAPSIESFLVGKGAQIKSVNLVQNQSSVSTSMTFHNDVDKGQILDSKSATVHKDSSQRQCSAAENIEPSTSREASNETDRRESPETNSHRLPKKTDRYSNNHRDDPAATHPVEKETRNEYETVKLREKSFKTWPLNKPTIVQLAEAGFFYIGYKNIAQCFSCGKRIHWKEDQDPLDEEFHSKCHYINELINTNK